MRLFLTSAGLAPETTEAFLKLLDKKPEETAVCFIPTASFDHHPAGDASYVKEDKDRLLELGFKTITDVDLRKENKGSLEEKLKGFDVIFVSGGNTFYLLKYVRESGFNEVLGPFFERGGIYVGVSAGSMIAGGDISPADWSPDWDENTVGLKDLKGLGLVNFYVSPHYTPKDEAIINKNKEKVSYPIYALTDLQAILVDNGEIRFIGPGEFQKFN